MLNLMLATFYRIKKSMAVKISFILISIAAILYFTCVKLISNGTLDSSIAGSISGLSDSLMLWLFAPLIAGVIVIEDFDSKIIHTAIGCGKGRISVVFSKMYTFLITTFILTIPYAIISFVLYIKEVNFIGAEATAISIYIYNLVQKFDVSTIKVISVYFVTSIVYMSQLSICIPIAFKVRKTVVVTAIGFIFGMLNAFISAIVNKVDVLADLYKLTPYAYSVDKVNLNTTNSDLLMVLVISIIFIVIMTGITYLLFRKEEIK